MLKEDYEKKLEEAENELTSKSFVKDVEQRAADVVPKLPVE